MAYDINKLLSLKMPYAAVLTEPTHKIIQELWAIQPIEGYNRSPDRIQIVGIAAWDLPRPVKVDGFYIYDHDKAVAWLGLEMFHQRDGTELRHTKEVIFL